MDSENKQLFDLIQSKEYFVRSRLWYQVVYVGPFHERSFFLVIAIMSAVVALMGGIALLSFLPVVDRPGILIKNSRGDTTVPRLIPLKKQHGSMNESLLKFFVSNYVQRREGYSFSEYEMNYRFIEAQSDVLAFQDFSARYDRANPNSPAAILTNKGSRTVKISSIEFNTRVEPNVATVKFSTEVLGVENGSQANWTAVIQYYYTDMVVTSVIDPVSKQEKYNTQDPLFKVVNYALTQNP